MKKKLQNLEVKFRCIKVLSDFVIIR